MSGIETVVYKLEGKVDSLAEHERRTRGWVEEVDKKLGRLEATVSNLRVTVAAYGAAGGAAGAMIIESIAKFLGR